MNLAKRFIGILISSFIIFMIIVKSMPTFAYEKEIVLPFNVLIINSYHIGHYWESYVMEGFEEAAEEYGKDKINIKIEYFDFRNRHDEVYIKSFIQLIENKYPKGSIDAIYTIDDEAFLAIRPEITNKSSEFYHLPLLFSGVDSDVSFTSEEETYITGIYQKDTTLENFNLILQLEDIKCINIITENSEFGQNLINKASNIVNEHLKNEITLNVIQSDYIEEIEEKLKELQVNKNSKEVVLIGGEFQYRGTENFLTPKKTIDIVSSYLPWPIYANDPTYIAEDILGGCMDIGQLHGKEIFDRVKRMIEGEHVSDIESTFCPDPKWLLKYKKIYQHNIKLSNIPRKCIVIEKKNYEILAPKYIKRLLFFGVVCISILTIFLIYKLIKIIQIGKRQKREALISKEREKMQTDFIVNISHELRTPINIILAGVSIIKMQLNKEKIDREYMEERLNTINQNGYRLLKLANNIIDIKKLECGFLTLNKRYIDIVEIVESIFTQTIDYANRKNIKMFFDTSDEEIIISADSYLIQRVILNLLSNAIKFTPNGGSVNVNVKKENDYVSIAIEDTGIGIEKEKLETIFQRFYQVDNSLLRVNEGSGIGLSIVKELVNLHNGKIEIESKVGKGTTIRVLLPKDANCKKKDSTFETSIDACVDTEMADVVKW